MEKVTLSELQYIVDLFHAALQSDCSSQCLCLCLCFCLCLCLYLFQATMDRACWSGQTLQVTASPTNQNQPDWDILWDKGLGGVLSPLLELNKSKLILLILIIEWRRRGHPSRLISVSGRHKLANSTIALGSYFITEILRYCITSWLCNIGSHCNLQTVVLHWDTCNVCNIVLMCKAHVNYSIAMSNAIETK